MDDSAITTKGEVYLGAWSDEVESSTGRTDPWFKVFLSDRGMLENIRSQDVRGKAKEGGKRYMLVMVEIGDDEQPVKKSKHMGSLSNVAAILCQDKQFGPWFKVANNAAYTACVNSHGADWQTLDAEDRCRELILYTCSINSRAKLDTDDLAAQTFREQIAEPFNAFKKE